MKRSIIRGVIAFVICLGPSSVFAADDSEQLNAAPVPFSQSTAPTAAPLLLAQVAQVNPFDMAVMCCWQVDTSATTCSMHILPDSYGICAKDPNGVCRSTYFREGMGNGIYNGYMKCSETMQTQTN